MDASELAALRIKELEYTVERLSTKEAPPVNQGVWTPTLQFGGASVGITYTTRTGNYTLFSNVVVAQCAIVLSSKGSSAGIATITGWPYTPAGYFAAVIDSWNTLAGITTPAWLLHHGGTAYLMHAYWTVIEDFNFVNTSQINFTAVYLK